MDSGSSCISSELNSSVGDVQSDECYLQIGLSRIHADFGRFSWSGTMPGLKAAQATVYVTNFRRSHDHCWAEENA